MRELNIEEVQLVDGASADGVAVVLGAAMLGAAVGAVGGPPGVIAGAISAGVHALILWNLAN